MKTATKIQAVLLLVSVIVMIVIGIDPIDNVINFIENRAYNIYSFSALFFAFIGIPSVIEIIKLMAGNKGTLTIGSQKDRLAWANEKPLRDIKIGEFDLQEILTKKAYVIEDDDNTNQNKETEDIEEFQKTITEEQADEPTPLDSGEWGNNEAAFEEEDTTEESKKDDAIESELEKYNNLDIDDFNELGF